MTNCTFGNPATLADFACLKNSIPTVAVLGVGSLGKEHARIYSELAAANLVKFAGVHDTVADTAHRISRRFGVQAFNSVAEAADACDALNIVTPTRTHFDLARILLREGKHVLVEKPMTDNSVQATELVQLALQNNRC